MNELLAELPLDESVANVLLEGRGELGAVLRCATAYELADWADATLPGVLPSTVSLAYFKAVEWADETVSTLRSS